MPKAYWIGAYDAIDDPDKLKAYAEGAGIKLGKAAQPLRAALTGRWVSSDRVPPIQGQTQAGVAE